MKLLVETTGDFQIYSGAPEQWARYNRPSVVKNTNFIQIQIANKNLTILHELPEEASDDDFAKALIACKGDKALAVASYKAEFEPKAKPAPKGK
jgi:hypothetical protein